MSVALHDFQSTLKASYRDLQWIINGYTLTFAAFLLMGSSLADRFGRTRVFILGMIVFALSSLMCGLAGFHAILIAATIVAAVAVIVSWALMRTATRPTSQHVSPV